MANWSSYCILLFNMAKDKTGALICSSSHTGARVTLFSLDSISGFLKHNKCYYEHSLLIQILFRQMWYIVKHKKWHAAWQPDIATGV